MIQLDIYSHCILSLDLALANTGFCLAKANFETNNRRIVKAGTIHTNANTDTDVRIRFILDELKKLYSVNLGHKNQKVLFLIEQPPDTLFGQKRFSSKDEIIGKCAKLFKLRDIYGAVLAFCMCNNIEYKLYQPSQWQPSLKQRKRAAIKDWSITNANRILKECNANIFLKYKQDEHAADAVNILFKFFESHESNTGHESVKRPA